MGTRWRYVIGALLVVAGAALWTFVVRPLMGPSEREWDAQIAQDALPLTQILRYDFRVEHAADIDAAWEKRRGLYDEEHLAELADRLTAFVEFQTAEYADAKHIYLSGSRPEKPSSATAIAHARLRAAFPGTSEEMISQFDQRVREEAYKASPKVAGGDDPDLAKYDAIYDDVVARWLPEAKATIRRLTEPAQAPR
jgi:hypothetical protein